MQFKSLATAALFLGLASASHHPRHFHMRRGLNTTAIAPGNSAVPPAPAPPLSTGPAAITTPGPVQTEDSTLTYTLGAGTSTTVVTTIIKHTQTKTVYATPTNLAPGDVDPVEHEEEYGTPGPTPAAVGNSNAQTSDEPTTTLSSTFTTTKYVTYFPGQSPAPGGPGGPGGAGPISAGPGSECVPVTVTAPPVTVTVAAITVTVTETGAAAAAAATGAPATDDEEESEACDGEPEPETESPETSAAAGVSPTDVVIVPSTATVVPVPTAPYGNGTEHTIIPTAAPSASGFIKSYY